VRAGFVVAVAIVLLASACGGGGSDSDSGGNRLSPSAYRAQLKTIGKESGKAQQGLETLIGSDFQSKTTAQLVKVLTTFAAAEKRLGDEVDALKPPQNAVQANSELAKGFHDTDSEVRGVIPKVDHLKNAAAGILYLRKQPPTTGGKELDAALTKLKQLGYIQNTS
jgi:hypothetical protein